MFRNIKILYAEDETFIRENMIELLEFLSVNVIAVDNGNEAYIKYKKEKPDIIIADIEMEGLNGLELTELIRKTDKKVQIIITTAYTNTEYLLKAVELNIVKYLVKPVPLLEIEKALNICISNMIKEDNPKKFLNDRDYYDTKINCLIVNNEEVYLDYNEKIFFELLLKTPGRVISYDELENTIWQDGMSNSAVRSLVFNLRKKLPEGCIKNISKLGYKLILKE
ncbi:DNA-binding response regulator [Halarcobacter ebronensis]|uniref:DNA-binding response regulator n=1 Tax=Halarcobacter ebronensis TaxID=1462615 RepID=A0A4Q0YLJ1_9BACT|nr:DNA-binding response regulator [Halarcobacter ebronensis]RXJ70159.1 DNA-binding response regulator [Halarcobacter ebronensis]